MRIPYIHQKRPEWIGAIRTWSDEKPLVYWAITDKEDARFLELAKAKRFMKRKGYIVDTSVLELCPEEARHVA